MATLLEQVGPESVEPDTGLRPEIVGRNPWALAARRLRRNRIALAALGLFLLIVVLCLLAPVYAHDIAHIGNPLAPNLNGTTVVGGKVVPVMQQGTGGLRLGETPIAPTWDPGHFFLGADDLGRDVASLLLYGGRASLQIGIASAVICCAVATVVALIAGFFGGVVDAVLSRIMDIIWAFPVYLLAICIATELLTHSNGIPVGPLRISATNLWVPTFIIAFAYVSYVYRPIRGQVLSVVQKEFVEAAIAQGASNLRLMFSEILPNVVSTVIVLLPLMIATNILTESALSFLSVGVQPPNVSWGVIIGDGEDLLYTRPWVSLAPGIMIVLTVLALNVFGDGIRDALDPRAKLRVNG
jgi:peptide/nickel transport system permease protein